MKKENIKFKKGEKQIAKHKRGDEIAKKEIKKFHSLAPWLNIFIAAPLRILICIRSKDIFIVGTKASFPLPVK